MGTQYTVQQFEYNMNTQLYCTVYCIIFISISMVTTVQVTSHYTSYGNSMFAGNSHCVSTVDMTEQVGKRGPFVECMIACNADSTCGSFWLLSNNCNLVNSSSCADLMVRKS